MKKPTSINCCAAVTNIIGGYRFFDITHYYGIPHSKGDVFSGIVFVYVITSFQESIIPLPDGSVSFTIRFHTPVTELLNKWSNELFKVSLL